MFQPPYTITPQILALVSQIQLQLGESKHLVVKKPSVKLRKENKIKTIHHSLDIEGSRDLAQSVANGRLKMIGKKSKTQYNFKR